MQINTIHKLQYALDTSVKILKFVWRHALTLIVIGMIVAAFIIGKISWINSFYFCVGAVFLDWFKMQFKTAKRTNNSYNFAQDQMFDSARRSRDDFSWRMNPMNPLNPMGSTYHTNNYTSNYY